MGSITCQICRGAIPDGREPEGHTALCAAVLQRYLAAAQERIEQLQRDRETALRHAEPIPTGAWLVEMQRLAASGNRLSADDALVIIKALMRERIDHENLRAHAETCARLASEAEIADAAAQERERDAVGRLGVATLALLNIARDTPHVPDDWCPHCYAKEWAEKIASPAPAPSAEPTYRDRRLAKLCGDKKLVLGIRPSGYSGWLYIERPEDIVDHLIEGDPKDEWELKWELMTQEEIDAMPEHEGW